MVIDMDALRRYLLDYCGTAAFSGMPGAMVDVWQVERAGDSELLRLADRLGVDLRRFEVHGW